MLLGDCSGGLSFGTAVMLRPDQLRKRLIKNQIATTWQRREQCKNQGLVAAAHALR